MTCPANIAAILLEIIQTGILNARLAGWAGNAAQAAAEADHVHNLPEVVADYSADRLQYYWDIERPSYLSASGPVVVESFQPLWDRLGPHVERLASVAAAG